jgi:phage virion morphogenesis protein
MPAKFNANMGDLNPGISITLIPTIKILTRDLNRFAGDIRSFRDPLRRSVREVMAPSFRRNFYEGGRPPWEPLQPSTLERRVRAGQGNSPLVATGDLQRAAGQMNIWNFTATSASIEGLPSHVSYGTVHQLGFRDRSGAEVPARPFFVVQDEDAQEIDQVFARWIRERLVAHGFKPGTI